MAAGPLEPLVLFWKEWGVLALVMLSFMLNELYLEGCFCLDLYIKML
jgi:hypothetical protein